MKIKYNNPWPMIGLLLASSAAVTAGENDHVALEGVMFENAYDEAVVNGAINILAQQCDDGGWGWPYNVCTTSAHNTVAPIVDGILIAYDKTELNVFLNAAVIAGDFNLGSVYASNGSARLSSQTALNLWNLSKITGDDTYSDWVVNGFYEPLSNGTYGSNADVDTAQYIDSVRNPPGNWINLRPWEFSYQALAAERYCYPAIAAQFEDAILAGLATLDNSDPATVYSDVIGLAGGVLGLAKVNRITFPEIVAVNQTGVNGETTLVGVTDYLASLQNANGSFNWHSNLSMPTTGDEDTQATSYAVLALIKAQERLPDSNYLPAIEAAKDWLLTMQNPDGSFMSNPGGSANTEVIAEAVHALGKVGIYDRIFTGQMECYTN